jgi:hypothetical protein
VRERLRAIAVTPAPGEKPALVAIITSVNSAHANAARDH